MLRRHTKDIVHGGCVRTALQKLEPSTGDEEIEKRNAEIKAARKKLLFRSLLIASCALLLLALFLLISQQTKGSSVTLPEDGQLLAVPTDTALSELLHAGDVVQLYSPDGEIPSLRYVSVASVTADSVLLHMSPMQITDYLRAGNIAVVPVICNDAEAAHAALEQQAAWNHPTVSLALSDTALTTEIGQIVQLSCAVTTEPEGAVVPDIVWTSSDDTVATVDTDGRVTALCAGKAQITASCGDKTATCTVSVITYADSLAFDAEAYSATVGQELALQVLSSPENITEVLTWISSDEDIATVSQTGIVTAHAGGSVTISVVGARAEASCTVNISVPAESIVLNSTALSVVIGRSGQLAAIVMPENASDKTLTWTSSDETIVKVWQDGVVQGLKEGTATITVTCGDVSATCIVTVTRS